MVWNALSCATENSTIFKQGKAHGRIPNTTCILFFCNTYSGLEWYCYIVIMFFSLVLLLGFLGNTFTLLYYICTWRSWTSSSIFLFNLALCDFTWILLIPFAVYYHLHKRATYSTQLFCQFKRTFFAINIYGSIYFLTLISFDRYVGAAHPIRSFKRWDKSKAAFCAMAVWIVILTESIPDVYYTFAVQRGMGSVACLDNIGETLYFVIPFTIFRLLFGFLIPLLIIFTCYTLTLNVLRKMTNHQQRRQRIVKPLVLVSAAMIVFVVAFIPYHVMILAVLIYRMKYQLNADNIHLIFSIYKFTEIICSVSSSLNPFIFMLASKKFQEKFKTLRCSLKQRCLCCQSHRVRDIATEL
ncbi:P2Y purinoceptor 1-like [Sceloporus undulatus]|uniref:P2Y purinoceptor 1-like n=1 Tax=Sceloporus undulatus TaxID=8520 RepID=UPI001C4B1632|nr:P2Y purinoceptor 1-like [Sceloporus undulatus]